MTPRGAKRAFHTHAHTHPSTRWDSGILTFWGATSETSAYTVWSMAKPVAGSEQHNWFPLHRVTLTSPASGVKGKPLTAFPTLFTPSVTTTQPYSCSDDHDTDCDHNHQDDHRMNCKYRENHDARTRARTSAGAAPRSFLGRISNMDRAVLLLVHGFLNHSRHTSNFSTHHLSPPLLLQSGCCTSTLWTPTPHWQCFRRCSWRRCLRPPPWWCMSGWGQPWFGSSQPICTWPPQWPLSCTPAELCRPGSMCPEWSWRWGQAEPSGPLVRRLRAHEWGKVDFRARTVGYCASGGNRKSLTMYLQSEGDWWMLLWWWWTSNEGKTEYTRIAGFQIFHC